MKNCTATATAATSTVLTTAAKLFINVVLEYLMFWAVRVEVAACDEEDVYIYGIRPLFKLDKRFKSYFDVEYIRLGVPDDPDLVEAVYTLNDTGKKAARACVKKYYKHPYFAKAWEKRTLGMTASEVIKARNAIANMIAR